MFILYYDIIILLFYTIDRQKDMELQPFEFSYLDQFKIIRTLGSGLHAKVKLAQKNGVQYAIKRYKDMTTIDILKNQLEILQGLTHPNVVRFYGYKQNALYKKKNNGKSYYCLAIILQYAEGGMLYDYIAKCDQFDQKVARTYFHMLIQGIEYIHSKGISHRDIKPQNILLDKDFRLKITDFGFSTYLNRGILKTRLGSKSYMAPEIYTKQYNGQKVDLFAASVILFIMYYGRPPFQATTSNDKHYKYLSTNNLIYWKVFSHNKPVGFFSQSFKDLINKMLSPNPAVRLTIQEIKNHQWYNGSIVSLNEIKEEFQIRKQKIMLAIMEEKVKKNLQLNFNKGTRGEDDDTEFMNIYQQINFNEKLIKTTRNIGRDTLVVNKDAHFIIAYLTYFLQDKNSLIIDHLEEVTENYKVTLVQDKPLIEICATYQSEEQQGIFKIKLKLGYNNERFIVINMKNSEGDEIYCAKLRNIVWNQLKAFEIES